LNIPKSFSSTFVQPNVALEFVIKAAVGWFNTIRVNSILHRQYTAIATVPKQALEPID
jgi:hypothetical protein